MASKKDMRRDDLSTGERRARLALEVTEPFGSNPPRRTCQREERQ